MLTQKFTFTTIVATLAMSFNTAPASAQEQIKATVMSGYTDRTAWAHNLKEFFIPEVNKRLAETGNYTLKYTEAFGAIVKPRG